MVMDLRSSGVESPPPRDSVISEPKPRDFSVLAGGMYHNNSHSLPDHIGPKMITLGGNWVKCNVSLLVVAVDNASTTLVATSPLSFGLMR